VEHSSAFVDGLPAGSQTFLAPGAHRAILPLVARGSSGIEHVAFLHGVEHAAGATIRSVEQVTNTHRSPGGFGISAPDYRRAVESGTLIGVFHTHARDSRASRADITLLRKTRLLQVIGAPGQRPGTVVLSCYRLLEDGQICSPAIVVSDP
jgi:proteasome lid subunit RPN8/RPN11